MAIGDFFSFGSPFFPEDQMHPPAGPSFSKLKDVEKGRLFSISPEATADLGSLKIKIKAKRVREDPLPATVNVKQSSTPHRVAKKIKPESSKMTAQRALENLLRQDVVASVEIDHLIKEYRPSLHDLFEVIAALSEMPLSKSALAMIIARQIGANPEAFKEIRSKSENGEWFLGEKGMVPSQVLFQTTPKTTGHEVLRNQLAIHLIRQINDDFFLADALLGDAKAVDGFHRFAANFLAVDPSLEKQHKVRVLWIDEYIQMGIKVKSAEAFCSKLSKKCGFHVYKFKQILTHVLDSVLDISIPKKLQIFRQEISLFISIKNWFLFRKALLKTHGMIYDKLIAQIINEKLFALGLFIAGVKSEVKVEALLTKIKGLPSKRARDPAIPEGFTPACVTFCGGYVTKDNRTGHAVKYVIEKQEDGTYTFIIVNTGEGQVDDRDGKIYDTVYEGLRLDDFSVSFLSTLLDYNHEVKHIEEMKELYDLIDTLLPAKAKTGRRHSKQKGNWNCVVKSQSSCDKYRLWHPSDRLYLKFKAFMTRNMIQEFQGIKDEILNPESELHGYIIWRYGDTGVPLADWLSLVEIRAKDILEKRQKKAEA